MRVRQTARGDGRARDGQADGEQGRASNLRAQRGSASRRGGAQPRDASSATAPPPHGRRESRDREHGTDSHNKRGWREEERKSPGSGDRNGQPENDDTDHEPPRHPGRALGHRRRHGDRRHRGEEHDHDQIGTCGLGHAGVRDVVHGSRVGRTRSRPVPSERRRVAARPTSPPCEDAASPDLAYRHLRPVSFSRVRSQRLGLDRLRLNRREEPAAA